MKKSYLIIGLIILIILVIGLKVFNFSGNKVEEIEDSWKSDNIQLMQHEIEGYYGCFGCSEAGETPALCIDPIMEMKQVEETSERHCGSDFEVVGLG